jgi:hypothetical protein
MFSREGRNLMAKRKKEFNDPPDFAQAMRLFDEPFDKMIFYRVIAGKLLRELLNGEGLVKVKSIHVLHNRLCSSDYGFVLRKNTAEFVRRGGRQLFYLNGRVLVRVKTEGTEVHPGHHMTVSLAEGLDWPEEVAKFNRQGILVPRLSPVRGASKAGLWRSLVRLEQDTQRSMFDSDDRWADSCHFDFAPGFDASGADVLQAVPLPASPADP